MAFIPAYVLILAATIIVDYIAGISIENSQGTRKKVYLWLSIFSNIGFLAFFKYFNFFDANIAMLAQTLDWNYSLHALEIILPIGLSFHTFQALSYTIEVYRGNQKAERNFITYALYVMFFPQLVAGPIERPQNLLHHFYEKHIVDWERIRDGLQLMLWGFFKKMVVADNLAPGINVVFNNPHDFTGTSLIIASIFFAVQIYCDFSGYSDIARGAARVLGFRLMLNFRTPYHSRSIAEFWKRWHISLSTWFKDYLYIPLGGNRVSAWRNYLNLFIVFAVSGFWHGANWTFIIWGALHGTYLVLSLILSGFKEKLHALLQLAKFPRLAGSMSILFTFTLVTIGWIFFRANSVSDAWYIITHLFADLSFDTYSLSLTKGRTWLVGCLLVIAIMEFVEITRERMDIKKFLAEKPSYVRWAIYAGAVAIILSAGNSSEAQFIYFQF